MPRLARSWWQQSRLSGTPYQFPRGVTRWGFSNRQLSDSRRRTMGVRHADWITDGFRRRQGSGFGEALEGRAAGAAVAGARSDLQGASGSRRPKTRRCDAANRARLGDEVQCARPSGLIDRKAPGPTPRLNESSGRPWPGSIESGPIPRSHGVVRWRIVDLCQLDLEEFRVDRLQADDEPRTARPRTIVSCPPGLAITRRRPARSRILKKSPRAPGGNRARKPGV